MRVGFSPTNWKTMGYFAWQIKKDLSINPRPPGRGPELPFWEGGRDLIQKGNVLNSTCVRGARIALWAAPRLHRACLRPSAGHLNLAYFVHRRGASPLPASGSNTTSIHQQAKYRPPCPPCVPLVLLSALLSRGRRSDFGTVRWAYRAPMDNFRCSPSPLTL